MADITTQQLAQILLGIARAQNAIVEAMENSKTGFRATHFRPAVESASRIRANRPDTLTDYPARLLLQMLGRTGPDLDAVQRDLERLLALPAPEAPVRGGSAGTAGTAATAAPADDDSLDMTR
jgi:hypothetical protein